MSVNGFEKNPPVITAESRLEGIPAVYDAASGGPCAFETPPPESQQGPIFKGVVMVVDDNPANLRLMEEMLQPRGYEVHSFPRGRLALAAAFENPPDLILLDVNMPEMTGYEVCAAIRASDRLDGVPVIFLSSLNSAEDVLKGFQYGAVDYVSKPFRMEEVHARVEAHVRLRRLQHRIETDNRRLRDLVQAQVERIAAGHIATTFAFAKLADARDGETGEHLERIQTLSKLLAQQLSRHPAFRATIGNAWIGNLFHASPLHDIGKVAIPDRILLKPGALTAEEFAIMKTHTTLGAATLKAVRERYAENEFVSMGIEIARSHHERWDGAGYPDGLSGERIPLCARIVAVADCYDALRSKRRYKQPFSHARTRAIILENAGRQFDPAVTAAFGEIEGTFGRMWRGMTSGMCE
jgi:putative two-component system response regulator